MPHIRSDTQDFENRGQRHRVLASILCLAISIGAGIESKAEVRIFACEPEWASLATEIGGDAVSVFAATHGLQDPHFIRAKPSLIAQIRRADLLFCSGAELEVGWLPVLMQRGARQEIQRGQPGHLMAADHVDVLEKPTSVDRSQGDVHASGNPHVHLDPKNIKLVASELANRLAQIDSSNADRYHSRLDSFNSRWDESMLNWQQRISALADMNIVVHHASWAYLLNWTGINQIASLERVPGVPPTASHLRELLSVVQNRQIDAIVLSPIEPSKPAEWLSPRINDVPIIVLPFTVGGSEAAVDLSTMFDQTLNLLEDVYSRR